MSLTLSEQYSIYKSFGLDSTISKKRLTFYYTSTRKRIGFEYPASTSNDHLTSGYIYLDRLYTKSNLLSKEKFDIYKRKASHNSDNQKFPKGCISTFDLSREELSELIELNIKYIELKLKTK